MCVTGRGAAHLLELDEIYEEVEAQEEVSSDSSVRTLPLSSPSALCTAMVGGGNDLS